MKDQYSTDGRDQHRTNNDVDRFNSVAVPHQHVPFDLQQLRHSFVPHQLPGFRSFGVISVAAVTAAEEELRIGIHGG
jgi:hypothetical protein